jgi:CcmD family protein
MKTLTAAISAVLLGVVVAAQPPDPAQGGFVPIDQLPAPESFPAAPLVIAAYAVVWLAVFLYVWSVWRRLARVERELKDVTARLTRGVRP